MTVLRLKGGGRNLGASSASAATDPVPADGGAVMDLEVPNLEPAGLGFRHYDSWLGIAEPWMLRVEPEWRATEPDSLNKGPAAYIEMGWYVPSGTSLDEIARWLAELVKFYPHQGSRVSFVYHAGTNRGCRRWGAVRKVGVGTDGQLRVSMREIDRHESNYETFIQ